MRIRLINPNTTETMTETIADAARLVAAPKPRPRNRVPRRSKVTMTRR
jgi:Asp/Glu/hydantoin racemase